MALYDSLLFSVKAGRAGFGAESFHSLMSVIEKNIYSKEEINNTLGVGLVKLKGSVWSATSDDGSVIPTDSVVIVKDIKGVKLIVSPVKE